MEKYKVAVTDYEYKNLQIEKEILEKANVELIIAQCDTEDEVIAACKDADGLINQYAPITRKVIESLPNLKIISRYGVGVNTIDVEAATERGIMVTNVSDYCVDEVADHAFSLLLASARKIVQLNNAVKQDVWDYKLGMPIYRLRGRVLGLVGFGKIPQNLAVKARAFGLELLIYDPYISDETADKYDARLVGLNELMQLSDFISVHAPLTKATEAMISDEQFSLAKPEAFIINTSRGRVIDEQALIRALEEGKIAGAALDVIEQEPINPANPLLKMDNVILNPHIAWYSEQSEVELRQKATQNAADALQGKRPKYLMNDEVIELSK
ncbi:2-hydroxyacid dehydrogenase [Bacillus sp. SA1-12]|uniref:C-terminal binding protein n=1 Tax=Bacillus sp. SA1-12 TaxID=1455638 RepID=UPI000626F8F3|nr:C-terminal binding protein [Bacillus sp. SA1-12]KKI89273.1 2-hydroxyacid dehydrogenase [Bacillus sp. SA1-12]